MDICIGMFCFGLIVCRKDWTVSLCVCLSVRQFVFTLIYRIYDFAMKCCIFLKLYNKIMHWAEIRWPYVKVMHNVKNEALTLLDFFAYNIQSWVHDLHLPFLAIEVSYDEVLKFPSSCLYKICLSVGLSVFQSPFHLVFCIGPFRTSKRYVGV